jgi:inosine-uridine nucleoside N-ribohydrolase
MSEKVLLDTDIGYDIDDAVCLAYLLQQPKCDLLGITTVTGEADQRASIASAFCRAAGKDIPIYPGAEEPLLIPQMQLVAPQAQALAGVPHQLDFPHGEAIEFMRHTIRRHPGQVNLLAIGPLTNIALLFSVDPEIPSLLKSLVMMGGVFQPEEPQAEWNARVDPHAAAIVYRASVPIHRSVGLDVTTQVTMPQKVVRTYFQRGLLKLVLHFAEVYFAHRERIVFHDPLAAATIFNDSICSFERGEVYVTTDRSPLRGRTEWDKDRFGPHEVATSVHPKTFFEHYFSVFTS